MHPQIFSWTNDFFYNNFIKDFSQDGKLCLFKPYIIFDLKNSWEINYGQGNVSNAKEINFIYDLLSYMLKKMPIKNYSYNILTPYIKQKVEFEKKFSKSIEKPFIDTIDSIQGIERDIVLFSNARTLSTGCPNLQRLNVAFTRAKKCLIIVGSFDELLVS